MVQCPLSGSTADNLKRLEGLVREAAAAGAQVIVTPELPQGPYFPRQQHDANFERARTLRDDESVAAFRRLAQSLHVVLPISFFERAGPAYYNTVAVIDAGGSVLGTYRKSHIPDGPGYQEKFYFRPGDTGFRVWQTRHGRLGVGICWDQWFPESARAMTLLGADVVVYPSAIGSEPEAPELDTKLPWQRVMVGHAVANAVPIVAVNRTGREHDLVFYGSSFMADARGDLVAQLGENETGTRSYRFDLDQIRAYRAGFGFFRDRRPELYGALCASQPTQR
ncbi:MAG: N-carbamoylputrescine amidase [Proteobacteria bacterium]|nr:N-carbamoylputrescine amidase [Pseudomonadota bacterium]